MKTTNLKYIAYALSALMLMQSCTVYQKNLSSIDEALVTDKKKKLVTADNETYRVSNIQKVDDNIILTTQSNSILAMKMTEYVTEVYPPKNQAKLEIPLEKIKGFYLKNKSSSTILTIASIALPIIVLVAIAVQKTKNCFGSWGSDCD